MKTQDMQSDESSSMEENLLQNEDQIETADEIDDHHGGAPANTASVFGASLNLFKSLVGIGILALPTAFSSSGWLAGMILLPLCAAGMLYLSHELMKVAALKKTNAKNLVHFVKETVSRPHVILVNICLLTFQTGACISYVIFFIQYIQQTLCQIDDGIFPCTSKVVSVLISLTFLIPLMFIKDMSKLKIWSMIGNIVVMISLSTVSIYCLIFLAQDGTGDISPVNLSSMGESIGVFIFAFEGVGVYFNIRNSMKEPTRFSSVLNYSISVSITLYCFIGLLGYLTFGKDVNDIILFSFSDSNIPIQIIKFIYCISLIFTYPVQIFPCINVVELKVRKSIYGKSVKAKQPKQTNNQEIENNVNNNQDSSTSGIESGNNDSNSFINAELRKKQDRKYLILSSLTRLSFIFLTFLVGILFDKISDFLSLTGDVCGIYLCYIIPVFIIYYQQKNYPRYKTILNFSIMIIAVGFGIYGLYSTGVKIKNDFF